MSLIITTFNGVRLLAVVGCLGLLSCQNQLGYEAPLSTDAEVSQGSDMLVFTSKDQLSRAVREGMKRDSQGKSLRVSSSESVCVSVSLP